MLIGGVGGLAAFKLAERFAPSILSTQATIDGTSIGAPASALLVATVAVSAVMATWPDIDKPDSFISHVARHAMWLAGAALGLALAYDLTNHLLWMIGGAVVGGIVGLVGGWPFLLTLRVASGGHRRGTHSLLTLAALGFGAVVLMWIGWGGTALLAGILAWSELLHLLGDVVTPGGVALFWPIWPGPIYLIPHTLALIGEPVAAVIAVAVGAFFIWFWGGL